MSRRFGQQTRGEAAALARGRRRWDLGRRPGGRWAFRRPDGTLCAGRYTSETAAVDALERNQGQGYAAGCVVVQVEDEHGHPVAPS